MDVNTVDKPHACLLCDKSFRRKYDLKRHERNVHVEYESKEEEDEESEVDDSESEVDGSESDESVEDASESKEDGSSGEETDMEDNEAYQEWYRQAKEATREIRTDKYDKYISQGMDEDEAKEKASMKTLWAVKHDFFKRYEAFLVPFIHLRDDETHQDIVTALQEKMDKGLKVNKALKRVMAKHQAIFDGLFHEYEEDDWMEVGEDEDD
jgi:hypothetical protein